MDENVPIADSENTSLDLPDTENENLFLKETNAHVQVPAIRITSIILVIASIILTLMFLTGLSDRDPSQKDSSKQAQEEKKETEPHTEEP